MLKLSKHKKERYGKTMRKELVFTQKENKPVILKKIAATMMLTTVLTASNGIAMPVLAEEASWQNNPSDNIINIVQECIIDNNNVGEIIEVAEDGSFKVIEKANAARSHVHTVIGKTTSSEKIWVRGKNICYRTKITTRGKCTKCKDEVVTVTTTDYKHRYVNGICKNCGRKA